MSIAPNPLNDISRVYLEQIVEKKDDSYLETDMKKRKKNNEKAIADIKRIKDDTVPRWMKSEEKDPFGRPGGKYGGVPKKGGGYDRGYQAMQKKLKDLDKAKKEALDPVGQEDADIDNDGDVDSSDKYLRNRRKEIGKAIKKEKMKEGFSNWRQDLSEVMDGIESDKKIKEKKVKNKIKINPKLGEAVEELGGTLLEMVSIDEEYLYETVDIASNYFYEQGLNENGVEILIEELGDEEFVSFVHDIREEITLFEARAGGVKVEPVTKTGKQVGSLKGGARTSAIKRLRKEKQARREAEARTSSEKPSGMKAALQRQSAMSSAKKQQKPTPQGRTRRGALDRIAGAVLSGMERHRKATAAASKMAKQTGETLRKAAPVARKAASEFGKGFTSGVKTAGKAAKDIKKTVSKEELELQEKPFDVYDTRRDLYLAKGLKTRKGARRRADREDEKYGAITTKVIPTGDDRPEIKYKTKKEEYEIDEKMNLKTAEMGEVIKDFQKSDAPQFKGKTKEERRQMAIAAKLTAERGGKKLGEQQEDDGNESKEKQMLAKKKQMMQKQYMLDKMRLQAQQQGKLPTGHRMEETAVDLVTNMIRKQQGGTYAELKKQGKLSKPKSKKPSNLKPTDMTKATDPRPGSRYRGD